MVEAKRPQTPTVARSLVGVAAHRPFPPKERHSAPGTMRAAKPISGKCVGKAAANAAKNVVETTVGAPLHGIEEEWDEGERL